MVHVCFGVKIRHQPLKPTLNRASVSSVKGSNSRKYDDSIVLELCNGTPQYAPTLQASFPSPNLSNSRRGKGHSTLRMALGDARTTCLVYLNGTGESWETLTAVKD